MKLTLRRGRGALAAALMTATLAAGPALADEPTPAQMDLAKKILVAVGLKASIDKIVPAMLGQLQGQLLRIHPEMGKPLHEALVALLPEFNKDEDSVFADTARPLARALSEAELQQTLTFFQSPAGLKYTNAQAQVLDALGASGAAWREKLTTIMLTRTREEMKKKGFTF
jgi:uncharacterized protein